MSQFFVRRAKKIEQSGCKFVVKLKPVGLKTKKMLRALTACKQHCGDPADWLIRFLRTFSFVMKICTFKPQRRLHATVMCKWASASRISRSPWRLCLFFKARNRHYSASLFLKRLAELVRAGRCKKARWSYRKILTLLNGSWGNALKNRHKLLAAILFFDDSSYQAW